MSKDAYYFSHDSNARNDVRMIKLRRMGNLEAIGLFWCVIEMLREAEGYELPIDTIEDICYEFRCDVAKFELLFICELIEQSDTYFYSNSLKNRMLKLDEIKEKRAIAGQKGGKSKANAKQVLSNKSKVKYSKEDKSKVNKSKELIVPTLKEFIDYAKEKKSNVNIEALRLKYDSWVENGWKDGYGNSIKNWKSKLLNTIPHLPEAKYQQTHDRTKTETVRDDFGVPNPKAVAIDPDRAARMKDSTANIGKG